MLRDFKKKVLVGALALAVTLALAAPDSARAAFQVRVTDVATGQSVTKDVVDHGNLTVTVGNFTITGLVTLTNNPGSPTTAAIAINNADVQAAATLSDGKGGTLTSDTLKVEESATGFTAPTGSSLVLLSNANGQVFSGELTGGSFTSYATVGSTIFTTAGTASPTITFTDTTTGGNFGPGPSNPVSTGVSLSSSYTLTNVGLYTLTAGTELTGTLGTTRVVVPAPASLVLLVSAAPLGLGGFWLRRRKATQV